MDALVVDARNLHHFLGIGKMFAHWIKKRIDENSYVNGKDYALIDRPTLANQKATSGRGGDRKSIGYLLSLNTAKEVAMMERNAQGRAVRNYFIDCEKQLYTQLPPTVAEDPPKVAPAPNAESGASTRIVAGDSIVMSPRRFDGFRAVMRARQDRLAILCCEVYTVSLKATEDKAIAELTTAAFLKVATPKLTKIASESDLDIATPDGLKAMIDAFNGWTHQPAT